MGLDDVMKRARTELKKAPTFEEAWDECVYLGDSDVIRAHVARALMKLPWRIREFAIDRCTILSIGQQAGITWPARIACSPYHRLGSCWLIIVSEELPQGEEEGIIAHEIAHAHLKHDRTRPDCPEDCEAEASRLVALWGFTGIGAEVK